jgi:hypothetical protein
MSPGRLEAVKNLVKSGVTLCLGDKQHRLLVCWSQIQNRGQTFSPRHWLFVRLSGPPPVPPVCEIMVC